LFIKERKMRKLVILALFVSGCAGASAKARLPELPVERVVVSEEGSRVYPYNTQELGGDLYCICSMATSTCECFDAYNWFNRVDPAYSCGSVLVPR
jgi:hypothetical protein